MYAQESQAKKNSVYIKIPKQLDQLRNFIQKIKVADQQNFAILLLPVQKQLVKVQKKVFLMKRDNQIKSENQLLLILNQIKNEIKNKISQIYNKNQNVTFKGLGQKIRNLEQQKKKIKKNQGIQNKIQNIKWLQIFNIIKPQCIGCISQVNLKNLIYIQKQNNLQFFYVEKVILKDIQKEKMYPRMCRLLNLEGGYIMIGLKQQSNNMYKPQGKYITRSTQEAFTQQIRDMCKYAYISFIPIIQTAIQNDCNIKKPIQGRYLIRIQCRPDPCILSEYGILKTSQDKTIIGLDQLQKWLYIMCPKRNLNPKKNTLTIYPKVQNFNQIICYNQYYVKKSMVQKIHSDIKKRRANTNKHKHIQTSLGKLGESNQKKNQQQKQHNFKHETYVYYSEQHKKMQSILQKLVGKKKNVKYIKAKQRYQSTNTIIRKNAWIINHKVSHQQLKLMIQQIMIQQNINRQSFMKFLQITPILNSLHIKGCDKYMKVQKELQNQLKKQNAKIKDRAINKLYNDKHEDKNYKTELCFNSKRESLLAYEFLKLKKFQIAFGV